MSNCQLCDKEFQPIRGSKGLYCSRSCAATANNRKNPKLQPQGRCATCEKKISTARKYCSEACRLQGWIDGGHKAKEKCHCGAPIVGRSLCKKHYAEYMAGYMRDRHNTRRAAWIETRGGACEKCGSRDRLEIDHVNREDKSYNISYAFSRFSDERMQEELAKCQVLCYDCHRSKTSEDLGVPHGGGVSGKKNCPCQPCKAKKAEYMRNRRLVRK